MTDYPKRFHNLRAVAALSGYELHAIRNDAERWTYVLTREAFTTEISTLDAVERWLSAEREALADMEGCRAL